MSSLEDLKKALQETLEMMFMWNERDRKMVMDVVNEKFEAFQQQIENKIVHLGMLRAGNISGIWDAGHAYGLLRLLGKAPTFKTRKEYFEWAEKNICKFLSLEEARKKLLVVSENE